MKKLIIFDLDGTLAESKQPVSEKMAVAVASLLARSTVAVVSGCNLQQLLSQLIEPVSSVDPELAQQMYLLPTSGAACYTHDGSSWSSLYQHLLSERDVEQIKKAILTATHASGVGLPEIPDAWGERIEVRGSQVTLSALGQRAPVDEKRRWDPTSSKKIALRDAIAQALPEQFAARVGGMTSVDVTLAGFDKRYGVERLLRMLALQKGDAVFIGDALFPGGNDSVVHLSGVQCISVRDPDDTLGVISEMLTSI